MITEGVAVAEPLIIGMVAAVARPLIIGGSGGAVSMTKTLNETQYRRPQVCRGRGGCSGGGGGKTLDNRCGSGETASTTKTLNETRYGRS